MARFKINLKRMYKEYDEAYRFTTSGYNGEFFNIPKSQITEIKGGMINVNDVTKQACYVITVTPYIFAQIEPKLNKMSYYHYKLLNN